jgi:hypothetical protein
MFLSQLKDPSYCVAQADSARTQAAFIQDHRTKAALLKIADCYLRIATGDGTGQKGRQRLAKPARSTHGCNPSMRANSGVTETENT